jgi:hypothetical protein
MKAYLVTEKFMRPTEHLAKTLVITQDEQAGYGAVAAIIDGDGVIPLIASRQSAIVDIQLLAMDSIVIMPEGKKE